MTTVYPGRKPKIRGFEITKRLGFFPICNNEAKAVTIRGAEKSGKRENASYYAYY
jgi:hypothetical protein